MEPEGPQSSWAGRLRLGAAVLCLAAAGGSAGFALAPEPQARAAAPVQVRVGGMPAAVDGDPDARARRLAARYLRQPVTLAFGEHRIRRSRSALGVDVDVERLGALLAEAADPRSSLRRLHAQVKGDAPLALPMPATVDPGAATGPLLDLKDVVDRPGAPARQDTARGRLTKARDGLHLHVAGTLDRLAEAARTGATTIAIRVDRERDAHAPEDLRRVSMDAVLGEFETPYNASHTAADRTHNLKVAARRIDGLILMPGETFSFNEVVGDRSEANGFRPAPQIAGGELVDGVGGGACQVAGTLHAAVFFAGLPILQRHPHSRPSFYIKLGLDAAVSYPELDFRFENDLPHPLVVEMGIADGTARVRLWGPERTRRVTFERHVEEVTPFELREQEDEELHEGIRVRSQRGVPGFEIRRRRRVEDARTGEVVRDEESVDVYPPTTEIWRIGTGEPPPEDYEPPEGDHHPEYVADEELRMRQGPETKGTEERRRQGRTGVYGWTEKEGLAPELPWADAKD